MWSRIRNTTIIINVGAEPCLFSCKKLLNSDIALNFLSKKSWEDANILKWYTTCSTLIKIQKYALLLMKKCFFFITKSRQCMISRIFYGKTSTAAVLFHYGILFLISLHKAYVSIIKSACFYNCRREIWLV